MTETITPQQFHEAAGIEDWRVLTNVAFGHFRTGSFAEGVALVDAIGRVADAANHERDVEVARQISAAARELDVTADPPAVQLVQVTIDALVSPEVMPFWRAVLGYRQVGDEDLLDPRSQAPPFWFQPMKEPRPQRNRIHIDVFVPHDQAEARVAAAIAAGGHLVSDEHAPAWWTLVDAEGNEVDVATWMGRD